MVGFGLVGGFVFLLGAGLLWFCVQILRVNVYLAYAIQTVVSIESNFFLNHLFNWRDREGKMWAKWAKFHLAKAGTVAIDQALFAAFLHFGVHYLVVKVMNTAIITVLNFVLNEYYVFRARKETNAHMAESHDRSSM
jgi:putative flippase GtrA